VARALIVGCGCRGRRLGAQLVQSGWRVRGTSRRPARWNESLADGIEPAIADPERPGSILELVADVTLVFWLLGSASGEDELVASIHGPRLERLLERLVDSPVRGFVYEGAGRVAGVHLERGSRLVREAGERWRIPTEVVAVDPDEPGAWTQAMVAAAERLTAGQ
jgi:uncharacterized protein YbjT (DUF2867 family)